MRPNTEKDSILLGITSAPVTAAFKFWRLMGSSINLPFVQSRFWTPRFPTKETLDIWQVFSKSLQAHLNDG